MDRRHSRTYRLSGRAGPSRLCTSAGNASRHNYRTTVSRRYSKSQNIGKNSGFLDWQTGKWRVRAPVDSAAICGRSIHRVCRRDDDQSQYSAFGRERRAADAWAGHHYCGIRHLAHNSRSWSSASVSCRLRIGKHSSTCWWLLATHHRATDGRPRCAVPALGCRSRHIGDTAHRTPARATAGTPSCRS